MRQSFTIYGRLPSFNELIASERGNKYAAHVMKVKNEDAIMKAASGLRPIKKPVFITYYFYEKDKRRDKDNISAIAHKYVQDALVKMGVLKNDKWEDVAGFRDYFYIDRQYPRIEIELEYRR